MNGRMPPDRSRDESILASLRRLSREGTSWFTAEAALARHELASDGRRLVLVMMLGVILALALLAAVVQTSLLLVMVLAPAVGGIANAAALAAIGMLIVAVAMTLCIWRLLTRPTGLASVVKRWRMTLNSDEGGGQ